MTKLKCVTSGVALAAWLAASGAPARDLQTIYSVGRYRVKSPADVARSAQDMAKLSPDTRFALAQTVATSRQFLYAPPQLFPLNVRLDQARAHNRANAVTARRTLDFSLAFSLTGDRKYRDKALGNFQAFINTFPAAVTVESIEKDNQFHIFYTRDWLPDLATAYDLLFNSLAPTEETAIRNWLKDMLRVIERKGTWERCRHTSEGVWQAAAIGIVGSATCDARLQAMAEERMRYLASRVVGGDGMAGGSLDFHYMVTRAFLAYAEATMNRPDNAYTWRNKLSEQYIKKMLDAPLMFVDPTGSIPGNDHMTAATPPADIYLVGAMRYKDPLYAAYSMRSSTNSAAWPLLLYGDVHAKLPALESRPIYSVASPTMGWGILRTGGSSAAREMYARLDFGSFGGHADNLGLYFSGFGKQIMTDGDVYSPDSPLHSGWARETIAHNTVVINYSSQRGTTAPSASHDNRGTLLMFDRTPGLSIVEADARAAYPFTPLVGYRRCVAMTDRYLLDVFNISSTRPVVADWAIHGLGKYVTIENATPGERSLNNEMVEESILGTASNGYRWIDDITTFAANEQWNVTWDCGLRTIMMGQPGTQIIAGKSGGAVLYNDATVTGRSYTQNTLIARRQNVIDTRFVALHEIIRTKKSSILSFARLDTGTETLVLEVIMPDCKDILILQPRKMVQDLAIDDKHRVTTEPRRYAYVRFARPSGAVMDSVNLTVLPPLE